MTYIIQSPAIFSYSYLTLSFSVSLLWISCSLYSSLNVPSIFLPLSFCPCCSLYREQIFVQIVAWLTFPLHSFLHLTATSAETPTTVSKISPLVTFFHPALLFFKALLFESTFHLRIYWLSLQ